MTDPDSYSQDSISLRDAGIVTIVQQKKGARFNLDSVLLADFCIIKPWDFIVEAGAGTGIISLLLAKKYPRSHIVAVEVQASLAKLCRRNIDENHLEERINLIEQDFRKLRSSVKLSSVDVIVANPPYTRSGAGKTSPRPDRLSSRHERFGDLAAWLDLRRFLKDRGRYFLVYTADRLADLVTALRSARLEPKRMRMVHPYQDKPASLVLMEAVKSAGAGLKVLPPLIVHETEGGYTQEMKLIYSTP
jgi:tRNA1Val (adenine37-N6)-methyltransferase